MLSRKYKLSTSYAGNCDGFARDLFFASICSVGARYQVAATLLVHFGNIPNAVVLISNIGIRRECSQHSDVPTKRAQFVTCCDVMDADLFVVEVESKMKVRGLLKLTQISAEVFDFHNQNKSTRPHDC